MDISRDGVAVLLPEGIEASPSERLWPYGRCCCCWPQRNRMRRGRGTETAIDAAREVIMDWDLLWPTLRLFPVAEESRGE
jgi:hypothetical protein